MLQLVVLFLRFQHSSSPGRLTLLGQVAAWFAVALLGLLMWFAADPEAHEIFHPDAAGHSGGEAHHCVVTDFTTGCTDLAILAVFVLVGLRLIVRIAPVIDSVARTTPRHKHAPSCGPPVAGLSPRRA